MLRIENEAKEQIRAAVARAESQTLGEIVPVVIKRSDDYAETRWMLALVFALAATPVAPALLDHYAHGFSPSVAGSLLIGIEFVLAAVGFLIGGLASVQRLLVHPARLEQEVHQRALEAFHALGVMKTHNRSGILLFISLTERRVKVLADQGIHERVKQAVWDEAVARLVGRIQGRELVAGVCGAIEDLGKTLAQEFPRGDIPVSNELPNHVVIDT